MFIQFNTPGAPAKEAAVIFVHGFTGDCRGTWGDIPSLLAKNPALSAWDFWGFGYETRRRIDLLHLWSADAGLEQIATLLMGQPQLNLYKAVAFVAHSMGGLVVQRAILKSADLRKRVSHVALFGTPSAGLGKAGFLSNLKQQFRDMNAQGDFIRQLRADWSADHFDTQPPFRFMAVAGELDQFVPPESSLGPFPDQERAVIPGNHISMLSTADTPAPVVQQITQFLTKGAALAGPRNSAALAVEMGEFQQAIDNLWPIKDDLDRDGVRLLAIALDSRDRRNDAITLLQQHGANDTDALGILAGRYKRRWLLEHRKSDLDSAFDLYRKAYQTVLGKTPVDPGQAFYHGTNLAYLNLATGNDDDARVLATAVLTYCAMDTNPRDTFWRLASEGDANTILGNKNVALAKHTEASRLPLQPWQALSIQEQAVRVADLRNWSSDEQDKLSTLYSGAAAFAQTIGRL